MKILSSTYTQENTTNQEGALENLIGRENLIVKEICWFCRTSCVGQIRKQSVEISPVYMRKRDGNSVWIWKWKLSMDTYDWQHNGGAKYRRRTTMMYGWRRWSNKRSSYEMKFHPKQLLLVDKPCDRWHSLWYIIAVRSGSIHVFAGHRGSNRRCPISKDKFNPASDTCCRMCQTQLQTGLSVCSR